MGYAGRVGLSCNGCGLETRSYSTYLKTSQIRVGLIPPDRPCRPDPFAASASSMIIFVILLSVIAYPFIYLFFVCFPDLSFASLDVDMH